MMSASSFELPYTKVNPIALEPAIAPHIAAESVGVRLDTKQMLLGFRRIRECGVEFCVVEGAGGWYVPLNDAETFADFAVATNLPVILVVGLKLGCINHAILSAQAIEASGATLLGWVGNSVDPAMAASLENIRSLRSRLNAPCLGIVNHLQRPNPSNVSKHLDIDVAKL